MKEILDNKETVQQVQKFSETIGLIKKELRKDRMNCKFLPLTHVCGELQDFFYERLIFTIVHLPVYGRKLERRKKFREFFREHGKGKDVDRFTLFFEIMCVLRR